jgi:hypothetical protein
MIESFPWLSLGFVGFLKCASYVADELSGPFDEHQEKTPGMSSGRFLFSSKMCDCERIILPQPLPSF